MGGVPVPVQHGMCIHVRGVTCECARALFMDTCNLRAHDTISHRFLNESLTAAGVQPEIRRIVKAIYAEATGMVRLRLPSGETLCSEPFPVRRAVIHGDIFSPQWFTHELDRIFRLHDIAGQGIGGPYLGDVTASKLEYADDVGLLDWRQLRPRSVYLRWREAREHPPRWRCRRPSRRAYMCTSESDYPCRRKWRLRLLTSHTAAPNARGRFRLDADWRCTELAGAARDSALSPDGASSLTKPSNW